MIRNLILLIFFVFISESLFSQKQNFRKPGGSTRKNFVWNYELMCTGVGNTDVEVVKCFSFGKNFKKARDKVRMDAVHGALFKGISGSSKSLASGCEPKRPIINLISYQDERDWFDEFFVSGAYLQYVNITNNAQVPASDIVKLKRGGYKVGFTLTIKFEELKKRMIEEGFSRSLVEGFNN
tara:strand:+ start:455 stop:997 length:543 start_codon:yes stop_codon:yes gene_type:complete